MMPDASRDSIRLALYAWVAVHRRARTVAPAAAAFEAALPGPIRGDERFQQALEDAETAGSLQRAIAVNDGEVKTWTSKAVVLLRAIKTADDAYERELGEALYAYRKSVTGPGEEDDADDVQAM
jgi:hypothetical protein